MNHEEMAKIACDASDHKDRLLRELEPAIIDSLSRTSPENPTLEIGTRQGGSAFLAMWHVMAERGNRAMVTVDADPAPKLLEEWADRWNIAWGHVQSPQRDFVRGNHIVDYGFIYLDADHSQGPVEEDARILAQYMARDCVVAIDDVQDWASIPDFSDVGLKKVAYPGIDQGGQLGQRGEHIIFYKKVGV